MPSSEEPRASGGTRRRVVASALFKRFERLKQLKRPGRFKALAGRWSPLAATGIGVVGLGVIFGGYLWVVHRPLDFGQDTWVIEPGDTLARVAEQLAAREVITHPLELKLLAYPGDRGRWIKAGEYRFPARTSLSDFLRRIVRGTGRVGINVTILEGWTFRRMRDHLSKARKLKPATAGMSDREIMALLGHPGMHPEGRFFPDTYTYTAGQEDLAIYRAAFRLMEERLDLAWENRDDDLVLANRDQALILASIIEKESWLAEEQRKIAGVFYNRLKKGMRLQTDPTVIYGLGDAFNGNLTRAHLKTDHPYNTYTRKGLPPTPISLPGDDALYAVAHPLETDAYYFVAKGGGRHQFSVTLTQHNKAVWEHIRRGKKRKKSP